MTGAERQRNYRARERAKLEALKAAAARAGALGVSETAPEVLGTLAEIRRLLEAQNDFLRQAARAERGDPILRQLTEIRRALGLTALHERPAGHTRRRPLGTA